MRFHLFGVPQVPVDPRFIVSPFGTLALNMLKMLKRAGKHVILYGAEGSTADCDEFVEITAAETLAPYYGGAVDPGKTPLAGCPNVFAEHQARGAEALQERYRTGDIALISYGHIQKFVKDIAPLAVEFCCGYTGIFTNCRVFPSRIWQHQLYGALGEKWGGAWHDAVIPHMMDADLFPPSFAPGKYLVHLGRLHMDKGTDIAVDIARRAGVNIVVAGTGEDGTAMPQFLTGLRNVPGVQFVGRVTPEQRLSLLRGAIALVSPVRYIESFGLTTIEALACGTPVIGPGYGAFPEIIEAGKTGFLCQDMAEFLQAVKDAPSLSREACRQSFMDRFSLDAVWPQYDRYFERLIKNTLSSWYSSQNGWRGTSIDSLLHELGDVGNAQIVEVGVGEGHLSEYLLTEHPSANLVMVDSWKVAPVGSTYRKSGDVCAQRSLREVLADKGMAAHRTEFAADRRVMLEGESLAAAQAVKPESVDLVFIDADHTFKAVCADIEAWWPKVKPGGWLAGHDFDGPAPGCSGVKDAVLKFSQEAGLPVRLEAGYVWAIQKPVTALERTEKLAG